MSTQQNEHADVMSWPPRPGAVKALAGLEEVYRPTLFDAGSPQERERLKALLAESRVLQVHDTLPMQLRDLVEAQHPSERAMTDAEAEGHITELLAKAGRSQDEYGTWVYYPWSGRLVRVLPREEFFFLRTDRNRLRLTMAQQLELRGKRIGVVGLSVGQATALTLALEGVGGHFKLADFDTLALSNLNRLRSGVHNLGINKGVMAAREMYELNPYLDVEIYPRGISEEQLDTFLMGGGRLDLLVEECDDLAMKVRLRERARELRMPVMMETSDRGMLDIERFDLEPTRPLLHGLMGNVDSKSLAGLPTKEKVPFFLRVVDAERMSPQLLGSLVEIKTTISTWPQLASAVALGGAVVTDAARRLLLGQLQESGRYYVDMSELVRDGASVKLTAEDETPEPLAGPTEAPRPLPRPAPRSGAVTEEELRYLLNHAILAPSGGNCQPWRFLFADGRLEAHVDPSRARAILDWRGVASFTAMGCALENLDAAAAAIGLVPDVSLVPNPAQPLLAFTATFSRGQPAADAEARLRLVYERVTNRRWGDGRPLAAEDREALVGSLNDPRAQLHLLTGEQQRAMGVLLGETDRFLFSNRELHHEMMAEMRWTYKEALTHRDGLELASMELPPVDLAAMKKVMRQWRALDFLSKSGAGKGLESTARKATAFASTVGLLTYQGTGADSYLRGGRQLARVWGTASARGLAVQPHSPITYLFARLQRGGGEGLTPEQVATLRGIRRRYVELFKPLTGEEAEVLLFRASYAGPPTVRSLRRELDDVFTFQG